MLRGQNKNRQEWNLAWLRSGSALASLLLMSTVVHGSADLDLAAVPVPSTGESPDQATRLTRVAPDIASDRFIAMGQATYVWTRKFGFDAPYTGPQSLVTHPESSYSLSFT